MPAFEYSEETTLYEAIIYLDENKREGVHCPCCNQLAKIYKRSINATMVKPLIKLYKLHKFNFNWMDYHHIASFEAQKAGGGDFAKLSYWGLIEEKIKDSTNTTSRTSGLWRITHFGKMFVEGMYRVQKYVLLYDSKLLRFEGDYLYIKDCLGNKFNYEELMNA
jgi:hypothetical protein